MPPKGVAQQVEFTWKDLLEHLSDVGEEYHCRVHLSITPLRSKSGRSTHALLLRAHGIDGRQLLHVPHEQSLWPDGTRRSLQGAFLWLAMRLVSSLEEEDKLLAAWLSTNHDAGDAR